MRLWQWVKFNETAQERGPREEAGLLQDLALRSVKANSSGWTETLTEKSKDFAKSGTKFLLEVRPLPSPTLCPMHPPREGTIMPCPM